MELSENNKCQCYIYSSWIYKITTTNLCSLDIKTDLKSKAIY